MEAEPGAHRVAEVGAGSGGADQQLGAGGEVGLDRCGTAVPGKVDEHQVMVGREVLRQWTPAAEGLGETVGEDERGSGTGIRSVQRGGAGDASRLLGVVVVWHGGSP